MAVYGQVNSYSNLSNLHVSIEDLVGKYPAKKFPLLTRLSGKIFEKAVDNPKYEWKEEVLRPTKDTLATALADGVGTTVVATTVGVFNVDDVIKIENEYMVVTAVATDGVTLTVVRGWESTGAAHAQGSAIYRVGVAAKEGANADGAVTQGLADLYNLSQIFEDVVELSGTEEESFLYNVDKGKDNAANQITIKQQELMEALHTSLLLGVRHDDTTAKRRTMGGLKWFIDTYGSAANKIDVGGAASWKTESTDVLSGSGITVAQAKLDDLIQNLVYERSTPTAIYIGYKALRKMMNWDATKFRTERDDKARGYQVPATYISQAGELDIVQIPGDACNDLIFVVDETRFGYKAFNNRGWFTEKLAKTGDSSKWQVCGEYTCKVSTPKVHGYLYNLGL